MGQVLDFSVKGFTAEFDSDMGEGEYHAYLNGDLVKSAKSIEALASSLMEDQSLVVEVLALSNENCGVRIRQCWMDGRYEIHEEPAPQEYDESYSDICWGWLISTDQTWPVVATFAHGERGNESFDSDVEGLHLWVQPDAGISNLQLERAAKALVSKTIGFGTFKSIVRQYCR